MNQQKVTEREEKRDSVSRGTKISKDDTSNHEGKTISSKEEEIKHRKHRQKNNGLIAVCYCPIWDDSGISMDADFLNSHIERIRIDMEKYIENIIDVKLQ